jgi:rhamnosyltransferase
MEFIEEQIESILSQTGVEIQIFVSVDLSDDGTEEWLINFAKSETRLTILPLYQFFGGAGPNFYRLLRDIDFTGFDYISYSDQDDIWHPKKLLRAFLLMHKSHAFGYSSNFKAFWKDGRQRLSNKAQPQRRWDFLFESAGPGCTYVLHSCLAKSLQHLILNCHGSAVSIDYHDWLTYAFARHHGFRWIIDDWASMKYRQHSRNQIGVNSGWRPFWKRVNQVLNGYGFEQSLLIADLINASDVTIVKSYLRNGSLGYLMLALRSHQCRRKRIDQFFFIISCILIAIKTLLKRVFHGN